MCKHIDTWLQLQGRHATTLKRQGGLNGFEWVVVGHRCRHPLSCVPPAALPLLASLLVGPHLACAPPAVSASCCHHPHKHVCINVVVLKGGRCVQAM